MTEPPYLEQPPDFEAEITILTEAEGGRHRAAFNGIHWDFRYEGDERQLWAIYPDFIDEHGNRILGDVPLQGTLRARMRILSRELVQMHRARIKPGLKFDCVEGPRAVAHGIVTSEFRG
jgi:hypothetical protein